MYRSFVSCDDPKGVVECSTIRKSKPDSHKLEGKFESPRMRKNLNLDKKNVSKGISEEMHNPSFFQVMEVSRDAEKLNQVTDSWSRGMTFDCHSKEFAKDLLRGALDLQESLVMLGKIEAASYMAKLKKKPKEKLPGGRVDDLGSEIGSSNRSGDEDYTDGFQKPKEKFRGGKLDDLGSEPGNSNRFRDEDYMNGFQKPRFSFTEPSRDCYEELRQVIRDGLAKQNLLPKSCSKERTRCDGDVPSSSSSNSSLIHPHNVACSDRFALSDAPRKNSSSPNLIAKLMGLEEIPPKQLQYTHQNHVESEKISSQRKTLFDNDMPKTRKTQLVFQKGNPRRRTLNEILETLQSNGLLKNNSNKGFKLPDQHPSGFCSEKRRADDGTPIVVIKPFRSSLPEVGEPRRQVFSGEKRSLDKREILRKLKIKEELPPKAIDCRERIFNERLRHKEAKALLAKPDGKKVKAKDMLSFKNEASAALIHKTQRKETIQGKAEKTQKATSNRRKPVETQKSITESHVQAKVVDRNLNNPKEESNVTKNRLRQQNKTASISSTGHSTTTVSHTSASQRRKPKNEKALRKPVGANLAVENVKGTDDTKDIITVGNNECSPTKIITVAENEDGATTISTAPAGQVSTEEEAAAPGIEIKEHSEVKLQTRQLESSADSGEEAKYCISEDSTVKKFCKTKTIHKDILLSSALFISRAKELFDINSNHTIISQTECPDNSETTDTELFLGCANELLEIKSLRCTANQSTHSSLRGSRTCISLDILAEEICTGIENLRSYSELAGENLKTDYLFGILERDLWCKGVVSGAWDFGWRNGFNLDEVEQVVDDMEELVLSSLIEEILTGSVL